MQRFPLPFALILLLPASLPAGAPKVVIEDGPTIFNRSTRPLDPDARPLVARMIEGGYGLGVTLNGTTITTSQTHGIHLEVRRNGAFTPLFGADFPGLNPPPPPPKPKFPMGPYFGKYHGDLVVVQNTEYVLGQPVPTAAKSDRARYDTVLCTCLMKNDGKEDIEIEPRVTFHTRFGPMTRPMFLDPRDNKILNGVLLEKLPEYLVMVEKPSAKDPGRTAVLTLRFDDRRITPSKLVLTNTQSITGLWDLKPVPVGEGPGDTAVVLYWPKKQLKPGEKVLFSFGFGAGKAEFPPTSGVPKIKLSGNFSPGKQFTITATVDEPLKGQTLRLELEGEVTLKEGTPQMPLVVPATGPAVAVWKASVDRPGNHFIRIHSSQGLTMTKVLKVSE